MYLEPETSPLLPVSSIYFIITVPFTWLKVKIRSSALVASYLKLAYMTDTSAHILNQRKTIEFCSQNVLNRFLHTYIIGCKPFSQDYWPSFSHHTISGETYSLKSTPNDWFLRNFSWQFYLLSEFLFEKSAERKSPKKYFSYFGLKPWFFHLIRQHTTYSTLATSRFFQ